MMKNLFAKKTITPWLMGIALSLTSHSLFALSPEQRGLEITQEADRRDLGWADMQTEMVMILRNAHGDESLRNLRLKSLEMQGDGDKSLSIFDRPRDVKGTAFLTFSHINKPDDQWLYLPALKRVKRISSKNKSGPFMGSEFAYEDLASFEVDKYRYKYLGDEVINGLDCYIVESYPVDRYSGYTRLVSWIDKAEYRVQRTDYYDRKNSLLKTMTFSGYQQYLDQYWRADKSTMVNHQNGKSTELQYKGYQFKTGLSEKDFNKNSLKRAK